MFIPTGVVASSKTNHLFVAPSAPTIGTATLNSVTGSGGANVTVTWTPASYTSQSQPTTYYVYCINRSGIAFVETASFGTNTSTFDATYAANTAYWFAVVAGNSAGQSVTSSVSNTLYPNNPPSAPTVSNTNGSSLSAYVSSSGSTATATFMVSWTAPTISNGNTPTGYYVYDNYGTLHAAVAYGTNTATFSQTVTALYSYAFYVKAYNASGGTNSGYTNAVTPFTAPSTPTGATASVTDSTHVSVAFTPGLISGASPATSYIVVDTVTNATASGSSSPITINESFTQGTSYSFYVVAVNGAGDSSNSSTSNSVIPYPTSFTANFVIVGGGGGGGRYTGGGAGGYATGTTTITPGTQYSGTYGAGGSGTTSTSSAGGTGGSSTWNGYTANGGSGGGYVGTLKGTGGASGDGHTGGVGTATAGGGGGGTATGTTGNGHAASGSTAGAGGNSLQTTGNLAYFVSSYGGGGGGSNTSNVQATTGSGIGFGGGSSNGLAAAYANGGGGNVTIWWLASNYAGSPSVNGVITSPYSITTSTGNYNYLSFNGGNGGGTSTPFTVTF